MTHDAGHPCCAEYGRMQKEIAELKAQLSTVLERIKERIELRLNNCLCEMKPDYDDSITGFNEAWDIVRRTFADAINSPAPVPPAIVSRGEGTYKAEKRCCSICDRKKVCHVCGDQTLMACSDCGINLGATVYVCCKASCRRKHESLCSGSPAPAPEPAETAEQEVSRLEAEAAKLFSSRNEGESDDFQKLWNAGPKIEPTSEEVDVAILAFNSGGPLEGFHNGRTAMRRALVALNNYHAEWVRKIAEKAIAETNQGISEEAGSAPEPAKPPIAADGQTAKSVTEEEIAQVLLDRFIERHRARGTSPLPCATKISECVPSYRDDFIADARAVIRLLQHKGEG